MALHRPKAFLLENVKNLLSHDRGNTFRTIYETLRGLEYTVHYQVLDGQQFTPQHRERVFIVGFDERRYGSQVAFAFPPAQHARISLREILELEVPEEFTLSDRLWRYLQDYAAKHRAKGNGFGYGLASLDGVARTLSARYYKDGSEILIPQPGRNPRRLTPRECARLMGFPDSFRIDAVSKTQAYRQLGNSVVYPLVREVGRAVIDGMQYGAG